jgi:predicted phosphodiesterase
MKTLIIADMHGKNPAGLVKQEQKESWIDDAVFLGDYDTPGVLRELRKLRIPKKFIVGNHDLHYVYELEIGGPTMSLSWEEYSKLWDKNPKEKDFIEDSIVGRKKNAGLILEDRLETGKTICYCHGGIVDSGSPESDAPGYVWQRMYSDDNLMMNFLKMIEKNYWVLFRGHDHCSTVSSLRKKPAKLYTRLGEKIKLEKSRLHIATVGAFFNGDYALFDSKTGILEYKNTGDGNRLKGI